MCQTHSRGWRRNGEQGRQIPHLFLVWHSDDKEVNKHVFQVVERAVKTNAGKEWYGKRPVLDGMVRKTLFEEMVFEQSPE